MPEEPVVSTKTGHVFEKRLIEKHIKVCAHLGEPADVVALSVFCKVQLAWSTLQDTGKDPITQAEASVDDLVEVKNNQVGGNGSMPGSCVSRPQSPSHA